MTLLEMSALYTESAVALRRRIGELRQAADHRADAAAAGDPGAGGADGPLLRQELSQT